MNPVQRRVKSAGADQLLTSPGRWTVSHLIVRQHQVNVKFDFMCGMQFIIRQALVISTPRKIKTEPPLHVPPKATM